MEERTAQQGVLGGRGSGGKEREGARRCEEDEEEDLLGERERGDAREGERRRRRTCWEHHA